MLFGISKKYILLLVACVLLGTLINPAANRVSAQEDTCGDGLSYQGSLPFDPGTYEAYLRLGRPRQSESALLYISTSTSNCVQLGSTNSARGDKWTKVGSFKLNTNTTPTFTLASPAIDSLPNANRPSLLIIPRKNPPCEPKSSCRLVFANNKNAYIIPVGTVLNEDSLQVFKTVDPSQDTIKDVDYYVGADFAYKKQKLELFDKRYIPIGRQSIYRVINYHSGQKIVLPEIVNQDLSSGFRNFAIGFPLRSRSILQVIGWISFLLLFLTVVAYAIRVIYSRLVWRSGHDEGSMSRFSLFAREKLGAFVYSSNRVKKFVPLLLLICGVLLCINIFRAHGLRIVNVSGESMKNTLQDKDKMIVNKFVKWWSTFNGQEYRPSRGKVVIVRKAENAFINKGDPGFVVKRIIGLPGERIVVNDHKITVYSNEHPKGFNPDSNSLWKDTFIYKASLFGGSVDVTLGRSEFFVVGDNRPGSEDSRTYGPVHASDIYGEVVGRMAPNFTLFKY